MTRSFIPEGEGAVYRSVAVASPSGIASRLRRRSSYGTAARLFLGYIPEGEADAYFYWLGLPCKRMVAQFTASAFIPEGEAIYKENPTPF